MEVSYKKRGWIFISFLQTTSRMEKLPVRAVFVAIGSREVFSPHLFPCAHCCAPLSVADATGAAAQVSRLNRAMGRKGEHRQVITVNISKSISIAAAT